jgi:hypothetical protein
MNALTPQTPSSLPAHLQRFSALSSSLSSAITGGIKVGGGHPSIGIKGGKWRLKESGAEEVLNTLDVNVVIVDANPYVSKVFYAQKYNPKGEEIIAPDCFSDNGQGPSAQASKPQCTSCAACPKNAWGSKINELGNKTKACTDYKKLAIVLADDIERNVYELRIPPASLQDLNKIMTKLANNRVPIPAVCFNLSFDPNVEFPKLQFKPIGYISDAQAAQVEKWLGSQEAKDAVGMGDVVGIATSAPAAPAPVVTQPVQQKVDFLDTVAPEPQETPKRRGRAGVVAKTQEQPAEFDPNQLSLDIPGVQAPAQAAPVNPTLTDSGLDALLEGIL